MQNDIFENAYFGKPYRTRDGRKAIYFYQTERNKWHELIVEGDTVSLPYIDNGLAVGWHLNNHEWPDDIVSEWHEEINEDELDKLAESKAFEFENGEMTDISYRDFMLGYKAGYRKAKEI